MAEEPVFSAFLGGISAVKRSEVSRLSNLLQTPNHTPTTVPVGFQGVFPKRSGGGDFRSRGAA